MPLRRLVNLLVKSVDLVDEPANQEPFLVVKSAGATGVQAAVWSTAYVNNLPDDAFLWVESGGTKDSEGKTTPRTLRHLPYKDDKGSVDLPHVRNALARIPQLKTDEANKKRLTEQASSILEKEGGGSTKEKSMETTSIQGDAAAETGVVAPAGSTAAATADSGVDQAMQMAESLLGEEQALAKQLSEAVQSVVQSVVMSKSMTPDGMSAMMKTASALVKAAAAEPDVEKRCKALAKAQDLMDRFQKSTTALKPGPQVPFPTGAGGEPWNGGSKPEGNLKPQFTAKGFTAGTGPSGNQDIPTAAGGTPPEGSPTATPKPQVTSFPGGGDITDALRKAAEALNKAVDELGKKTDAAAPAVTPPEPAEKKSDAAPGPGCQPAEKKSDAAPAVTPPEPAEKKSDAKGTVGPQGSSEGPMDEIAKALGRFAELTKRIDNLELGRVGPGSKGAPPAGTEGDQVEKAKKNDFWKGVV